MTSILKWTFSSISLPEGSSIFPPPILGYNKIWLDTEGIYVWMEKRPVNTIRVLARIAAYFITLARHKQGFNRCDQNYRAILLVCVFENTWTFRFLNTLVIQNKVIFKIHYIGFEFNVLCVFKNGKKHYLIARMSSPSTECFYIWFGSAVLSLAFQVFELKRKNNI